MHLPLTHRSGITKHSSISINKITVEKICKIRFQSYNYLPPPSIVRPGDRHICLCCWESGGGQRSHRGPHASPVEQQQDAFVVVCIEVEGGFTQRPDERCRKHIPNLLSIIKIKKYVYIPYTQ